MDAKEFEDLANNICEESDCGTCILQCICNSSIDVYNGWEDGYKLFIKDIQCRSDVMKWIRGKQKRSK